MQENKYRREIDHLGRIILPEEARKKLSVEKGESVDVVVGETTVTLEKSRTLAV